MPDKTKQAIINICNEILHELADVDGNMYPAVNVLLQNPRTKERLAHNLKQLHNTIKLCQPTNNKGKKQH